MTSPVSAIEAIEKAMEGVTVEEWIVNGDRFSVETDATFIPDQNLIALCATGDGAMARALYIAACNPVAMREVLALARQAEALQRENAELREALKPFVSSFEARRYAYSKRYKNRDLGYANFDKMPDGWAMEHISFNMGVFRRARALLGGYEDAGN